MQSNGKKTVQSRAGQTKRQGRVVVLPVVVAPVTDDDPTTRITANS